MDSSLESLKQLVVVGNPSSCVAVVSLWTPKELIARMIDSKQFFLVGGLVSFDGINSLIRTIYQFPQIRYLLVCGQDRSDSGKALKALIERGVSKNGSVEGYPNAIIDQSIPRDDIELFRKNVQFVDLIGELDGKKISQKLGSLKPLPPFSKPKEFSEKKSKAPTTFPSWFNGMSVQKKLFDSAWKSALHDLIRFGKTVHYSGTDFRVCKKLPNYSITCAQFDASVLKQLNAIKSNTSELNESAVSMAKQMVLEKKKSFDSTPFIVVPKHGLTVSFQVIESDLFASARWESCEMLRDFFAESHEVRKMQEWVAQHAGLTAQSTHLMVSSAVLFESDFSKAESLAKEYFFSVPKPSEFNDPHGNWVISVKDSKIVALLTTPDTIPLAEFRGNTAKEIFLQIERNHAISDWFHALDIGAELEKAELSIKFGKKYVQDQPLNL